MPWVMTLSNNAPRAEGIINSLHCSNAPLTASLASGSDRNVDWIGNIAGVGMANRVTGVDMAKADQVEVRVGYIGMKNGRLRKCCSASQHRHDPPMKARRLGERTQ